LKNSKGYKVLRAWLKSKDWKLAQFQADAIEAFFAGKSGLINAPTGSGKTYSLWFPVLINYINTTKDYQTKPEKGLQVIWVTPLRALAKDLQRTCSRPAMK
jgi:ATP-dependent Lhr-like helicase